MPSSRAVALKESPLSLACCTFSHRVLWRAVGICPSEVALLQSVVNSWQTGPVLSPGYVR